VIAILLIVRMLIAGLTELGNDEVYYWTYALYPDWSHFDHPPMVGWLIQLFTFNLRLNHEIFIRLGALLCGTMTTWIVFLLGRKLKDDLTGFYAAALYSASIYGSVIAGTFILPDSGQMVYWTASIYFLVDALAGDPADKINQRKMLAAGLMIGLGMLSKYTSIMLWVGALAYVLLSARRWLRSPLLYISMALTVLLFLPVLFWNWREDFVSFTYHSNRVEVFQFRLRPDYFLTEISGTFLYQNPINVVLIILSLLGLGRSRKHSISEKVKIILWCSLPLALIMPAVSLFRSTLPHWSGPAYVGLILIAALWLRGSIGLKQKNEIIFPLILRFALGLTVFVAGVGIIQVRTGVLTGLLGIKENQNEPGANDFSLDLFGWKQLHEKFNPMFKHDMESGLMRSKPVMLSWRWFPAANLDHYVATPLGIKLYAEGELERIHKYKWINLERGTIPEGSDAYFICSSREFADPVPYFSQKYKTLFPPDTIAIVRGGKRVMEFYIYRLKDRL